MVNTKCSNEIDFDISIIFELLFWMNIDVLKTRKEIQKIFKPFLSSILHSYVSEEKNRTFIYFQIETSST